ncbi:hypothetical protein C8R43DRAFT_1092574 [Mycena crocata]|nr:hypothetical protein C8R43DRAFT_1092574 [Mycena crocata]
MNNEFPEDKQVEQLGKQQPVLKIDSRGQTVMLVGANTGLGFEAVKHFATMKPGRLILACRSQSKGEAALEKLQAATGCTKAELWIIDLSDFASVTQFADKFDRDGGRLDILVENAAVAATKYCATKAGYEISLHVNCLSTPLLALRLLPAMIKTAHKHSTVPRLVVVSSGMHYFTDLPKNVYERPDIFKTLGSAGYCTSKVMQDRYSVTKPKKVLCLLFVRALNARLPPTTPLVADAVCPGLMEKALALPTEVGSRQLIWAAIAEQDHPEKLCGGYVSRYQTVEPSDFVVSPGGAEAQDHVWDDMVAVLNKVDPNVNTIIEKYLSSAVRI